MNLTKNVTLELKHRFLDNFVVEVDHVGRDLSSELGVLVHNRLEVLFTKAIGVDVMECLIEELGVLAEKVIVTANDCLLTKFDMEVPLLLFTEADAVLARFLHLFVGTLGDNIDLLIDFIAFLKDVLLRRVEPRFKRL